MILCGIDSSSMITGLSFFKDGEYYTYDLVNLSRFKGSPDERLDEMILQIYRSLDAQNPETIYQEYTWVSRNPKTALMLTMILGAVKGWALANNCVWHSIAPATWRSNLGINNGKRNELKAKSIDFVKQKLNIDVPNDDVADAICIGMSAVNMEENE